MVFPLKVTLEDLYNGTSKKLRLTKSIICSQCAGKGGKGEATCRDCKGHGVKLVIRQLGPGMIQQMQTACGTCRGTGNVMAEKDKCKKCNGDKTTKEKKTLEVFITKGMRHSEKIVFNGEADEAVSQHNRHHTAVHHTRCAVESFAGSQPDPWLAPDSSSSRFNPQTLSAAVDCCSPAVLRCLCCLLCVQPDTIPGDVVVVLQQAEHASFKREGSALFCKRTISLVEALTGFHFYIPHLDGRVLDVKSDPGSVYRPGDIKAVLNEGMPQKANPYVRGNLYIELDVTFPDKVSDAKKAELLAVLGAPAVLKVPAVKRKERKVDEDGMEVETEVDDVPEEAKLVDVDMEAERAARQAEQQQQREQYDEDEDGGRGRGQPGCRAQ